MGVSSPQLECYKPSGAAPVGGIAVTLIVSVSAGAILGAVYAFLIYHNPLVYLGMVLAVGLAWALAKLVRWGVVKFHIRNPVAALLLGLTAFTAAYAVHWPVYAATVIVDSSEEISSIDVGAVGVLALHFAQEPALLLETVQALNEEGVWSISFRSSRSRREPVNGIILTLVWVAEALVIVLIAMVEPCLGAGMPYSERQGKWIKPRKLPNRVAFIEDREAFLSALAREDYSALMTPLPAEQQAALKYAEVFLFADPFDSYLSVGNISTTLEAQKAEKKREGSVKKFFSLIFGSSSKKGTSEKTLVQYLKISPTAAQNISNALSAGRLVA